MGCYVALVCTVCTYTTFFQRKKFLVQYSFFFNSTPPISVHCFFPIAACPAILALLQSSSYEDRGTEWSKIRVFGMLQRVRAGRDLPVDWLNIYGEGDGEACLWGNAKRTDTSSETTPWGQRKILLPLSSSALQMSILYPACECPYYAACVVFIIHSRSRCITVVSIFTTTYTEMLPIRGLVQHV